MNFYGKTSIYSFLRCGERIRFFRLPLALRKESIFQKGVNMSKENKTVVLLVTAEKRQSGTQSLTEYSGIFAAEREALNETEKNVFDMVRERPDCWSSGCVTGYPESLFTEVEREALRHHGLGKRFSM